MQRDEPSPKPPYLLHYIAGMSVLQISAHEFRVTDPCPVGEEDLDSIGSKLSPVLGRISDARIERGVMVLATVDGDSAERDERLKQAWFDAVSLAPDRTFHQFIEEQKP